MIGGIGRGLVPDSLLERIVEVGLLIGLCGDLLAPRGVWGQYPVIAVAMASWRRDQRHELVDQFQRLQLQHHTAVGRRLREVVQHGLLCRVVPLQSVVGKWRTGAVAQQPLESGPVPGLDAYRSV